MPIQTTSTMATLDPDAEGFKPVTKLKPVKKARSTPNGVPPAKPEFEMEICVVFQLPNSNRETFHPAQQMQTLTCKLLKYDLMIAFGNLNDESDLLYPQYDAFPVTEKAFEQHFYLHPAPKKLIRQNTVTIGGWLFSTKKLADLKKATNENGALMEWLKSCYIFIEADSLGYCTIRTLGYFFFAHPNITHCTSLKGLRSLRMNISKLIQMQQSSTSPANTPLKTMKIWMN